jgi:hypothetical protein
MVFNRIERDIRTEVELKPIGPCRLMQVMGDLGLPKYF